MAGQPPIAIEWHGDVAVVPVDDATLADLLLVDRLGDQLCALLDRQPTPRLIVDLGEARHVSSATLSMLVKIRRKIEDARGSMQICGAGPEVRNMFTVTGLEHLFAFAPSRDEALACFDDQNR